MSAQSYLLTAGEKEIKTYNNREESIKAFLAKKDFTGTLELREVTDRSMKVLGRAIHGVQYLIRPRKQQKQRKDRQAAGKTLVTKA